MTRNKKKIIRTVTVSNSIDFFTDVMMKMKEDGYETVVVTSPGEYLDEFRVEHPDFKTIEVAMKRPISPINDLISLIRMIKVFRKEKPYVVHSMTPKAGLTSMLAGWLTGVPIRIHTFTGLVWPTASGLKKKLLMNVDRILCSCATHIIPEGQGVLNDLKNNGVCKHPMRVIGYGNVMGVDMERFNPNRPEIQPEKCDAFTFVFVGRIVGDKGINELVEAFDRLHQECPNTQLILVGRYEKDLDPISLKSQMMINESEAINAVGVRFNDDLLKEYMKADCFVMPSYREGFPNSVLEAGALGKPCVVTDINGSREIISNEVNGLIVPSKDADSLYEAMKRVYNDEALRNNMASNARKMINDRFEKGFVQNCLIEYYKEIIK